MHPDACFENKQKKKIETIKNSQKEKQETKRESYLPWLFIRFSSYFP